MLVFSAVTSLVLVYLSIEPSLGMTLSDDQRESTRMAPADDQLLEITSQMSVTEATRERYTESREVQEHINRLFTSEGQSLPTVSSGRTRLSPPTVEVPSCATERAYCTEEEAAVTDDISDAVNQLLGSNQAFRQQFNASDVLTQEDKTIIERGQDDPNENDLCGFKVELSRITWATSVNNVVMRIAQSRDFVQALRLELCTDKNCGCHAMFTSGLPGRYVARCKQKYVYRQLLALTEDAKKKLKLVANNFQLPSCCSCVITKQLNISDDEKKCEKDKTGVVERISPEDHSPPGDEIINKNTASQSHSKHSLLHIICTTIYVISFIYSHFK